MQYCAGLIGIAWIGLDPWAKWSRKHLKVPIKFAHVPDFILCINVFLCVNFGTQLYCLKENAKNMILYSCFGICHLKIYQCVYPLPHSMKKYGRILSWSLPAEACAPKSYISSHSAGNDTRHSMRSSINGDFTEFASKMWKEDSWRYCWRPAS